MLKTCPRCGEKSGGFMKLCGRCQQEANISSNPKDPKRPIKEPEE